MPDDKTSRAIPLYNPKELLNEREDGKADGVYKDLMEGYIHMADQNLQDVKFTLPAQAEILKGE